MTNGWFVGGFSPAVLETVECEVAIKSYSRGDYETSHYHAVATEVTAIISGRAQMMGSEWGPGDIVTVEPGEATDFKALTDVVTVVVKRPSVENDKFLVAAAD